MIPPLPLIHSEHYDAPVPPGHRFPMPKFLILREVLDELGVSEFAVYHRPEPASAGHLGLVHTPEYVEAFTRGRLGEDQLRRIGLPWSPELVRRTITAVGGTILTVQRALETGLACNTAGGTHHAFPDHGSGFCIFNDLAVAARVAVAEGWARRVLIVDLDVHQGDGTAVALAEETHAFTFSMHCRSNFPLRKQASDLDVAMEDHVDDEAYLDRLERVLPELIERVQPDLVLYDAGVDVHKDDRLGRLDLTDEGILARDGYVLSTCLRLEIPVAAVIGGGYDHDHRRLAMRHALLHRAAPAGVAGASRGQGVNQPAFFRSCLCGF
jgi:acetoin utilization deacetylase AcuC-like enzyme